MKTYATDAIRNVGIVGHGHTGKTQLVSSFLFTAGMTPRFGKVNEGSTVTDWDEEEIARKISIQTAIAFAEWQSPGAVDKIKINLLDTPGEPSFVADALGALRICESAVFVVNAVMGVEVSTSRLWARAAELDVARMLFVNMLDRERADFFRTLEQIKRAFGPHAVATEIPIGSEHSVQGVIDLIDMTAFRQDSAERNGWSEITIPDSEAERAQEYRDKLMDEVCEVSDTLMERYLDGERISHQEIVDGLKEGANHGKIFPVVCGVATGNLGTTRLLDAIVEDLPSPVKHGMSSLSEPELHAREDGELFAFVFKTRADAYAGRINLLRVYQGVISADGHALNTRAHVKERIGQLLVFAGDGVEHVAELGAGDIGAVAKLKETRSGDWLVARETPIEMPRLKLPAPVMAFAIEPKSRGEEEKVFAALRRLQEEDPTIDLHRDQQTGEQIVAGLSQVHVEVIVERLRDRFGVEVTLQPPRVPYQETIRRVASARGRHKKQSGGRGQFGDCQIEIEPLEIGEGLEFVDETKGGVIPHSFIPGVEQGVREAMRAGTLAGYPVKGVRVRLVDGSHHSVDSSEIAFKLAGAQAMREALEHADPVLLEPLMLITLSIPEQYVGEVIGDLNSRRGHPLGMAPAGEMTEIRAEAPMAEMLSYAPDLRSITGGQGDYTLEFLRYQEVPAQLAQKLVAQLGRERAAAHA